MSEAQRLADLAESIELPAEFDRLPVFVVGGAVRDALRGVESDDIDLMVCETDRAELLDRGFTEIDNSGNDTFGVFIDSLGREVALAREESSTGPGHTDFTVEPVPADVHAREAVERDLLRRDFTVNSIALDVNHNVLHDPHDGRQDLKDGIIRATDSAAFAQDSLRILRGARFAARLKARVDDTTLGLMSDMAHQLSGLPNERIRMELEKTLKQADTPSQFFMVLHLCDAERIAFPEIAGLHDVPAWEETMDTLDRAMDIRPEDTRLGLMILASALGETLATQMASRLKMSNSQRKAMEDACRLGPLADRLGSLPARNVLKIQQESEDTSRLLDMCKARRPEEYDREYASLRLGRAVDAMLEWSGSRLIEEGYNPQDMGGEQFGQLLKEKRVEHIESLEEE